MEQHQHYQSLQDQAYNALRSKIIYAELKPGTRLSAIGLEKETGIGRTPIRESFVRLREQELVETRPKSGTYVSKISMERAENACFLREKLERSVLIKCCSAASPEQKQRLEQILTESESLDHSETRRFFDLDNLFHETCFEIAGRHMLWDWMKSINTHFERYNWLRMVSQDLDWEPIRRQHRRILEGDSGRIPDSRFLRSLERLVPYHALAYDRTDRYRNHDRQEDTFDRSAFRLLHTRRNIRLDLPAKRLIGDFRDHG